MSVAVVHTRDNLHVHICNVKKDASKCLAHSPILKTRWAMEWCLGRKVKCNLCMSALKATHVDIVS